jgi:hypothetical protein
MADRPVKITFAEMRDSGVRGILVYCTDYRCSHSALIADHWPGDTRLSDIEPLFVCSACGKRGADVRPNFNWNVQGPIGGMGYRVSCDG